MIFRGLFTPGSSKLSGAVVICTSCGTGGPLDEELAPTTIGATGPLDEELASIGAGSESTARFCACGEAVPTLRAAFCCSLIVSSEIRFLQSSL
jgi:hypothetical protein